MENTADEIKHLQGCINDLISVLALYALWSGREPSEMVRALLDGLLGMQRLDFVYARLSETIDGEPVEVVRWAQRYDRDVQAHAVGRALDRWLTGDLPVSPLVIANPLGDGEVAIAAFRLGLQDHLGVLVAGSARRDFPTQIERLLLRVAANQAAIGLQEAWLLSAQKRAAKELEQRVAERTRQLSDVNEELRQEISERKRTEEALRASYNELQRLNEELQVTYDELEETTEALESSRDALQAVNEELQARVAEVSLTNSDLRNLMESTDIGTIFLDRELCIKRYTPHIEKLFNVLPSDINRPLAHLTHRLDHTNLQEDARQVLADLQTVEREVHSRDDHWYIVRLLPYRTEEDKIDGVVVTFVEITERKRTEADLQKAQAELTHVARVTTLGEMTASIAHEVNQPLAAIVTNGDACLRLLARDKADLAGVREAVEAMISDARRASEVIMRIRTLLKKTASEKTWLDINATIREVIQMAANELDKNQVELRTQLAAGLQPALGDRVQLQQVILNLILNGNDAMSKTGWQPRELLISSQTRQPEEVMVAVRDSGTGLKPPDAERIFEPFFTTKEGGLGLGLSISRTIIEAHGGRLWATANEGQGTTLHFTLPTYSESLT
jgi:C4-dicarboxylate-specific signal transduction histidine kinase